MNDTRDTLIKWAVWFASLPYDEPVSQFNIEHCKAAIRLLLNEQGISWDIERAGSISEWAAIVKR